MAQISVSFSDDGFIVYTLTQVDGTKSFIQLTDDQANQVVNLTMQAISIVRQRQQPVRIITPPKDAIIVTGVPSTVPQPVDPGIPLGLNGQPIGGS